MNSVLLSIMLMTAGDQTAAAKNNWVIVNDEYRQEQRLAKPITYALHDAEIAITDLFHETCEYEERLEDYERLSKRLAFMKAQTSGMHSILFLHTNSRDPSHCKVDDLTYRKQLNAIHHQLSSLLNILNKKAL